MATKECPVHPSVKQWLLEARETDTILVQRSLRNSARVLRNAAAEKTVEMERMGANIGQLASLISGLKEKETFETGETDNGLVHCGQVVGLIKDIPSVKELIDRIVDEAKEIRQRLSAPGIYRPVRNLA
ncbi:NAD(P)H-dependent flavin oxidoreductase [Chloroflexota bacterium]